MKKKGKIFVGLLIALFLLLSMISLTNNQFVSKSSIKNETSSTSEESNEESHSEKNFQEDIENVKENYKPIFANFNGSGQFVSPAYYTQGGEKVDMYRVVDPHDNQSLSNGDTIDVQISNDYANDIGEPSLTYETITFTVEELKDADFTKLIQDTREGVIKPFHPSEPVQKDEVEKTVYRVSTFNGKTTLSVRVYSQFTYGGSAVMQLPFSDREKFNEGDTVYYRNETNYELDENGNTKAEYPDGVIAAGNISGFGSKYTRINKTFSKTKFDANEDKGYTVFDQ